MLDLDMVLKETRLDDTNENKWERLKIKTCGLICSSLVKEQGYMFLQETFVYSLCKEL